MDATRGLTRCAIERAYVDKDYRDHETGDPCRVFISRQKRGVFGIIGRELRRIGHMKTDGDLGRCHFKGHEGDTVNVILTAVGYNPRLVLAWLRILLCLILLYAERLSRTYAQTGLLTAD